MAGSVMSMKSILSPMSSQLVMQMVNGSHKFVIQGYSLAKGMGVRKYFASDLFTGGYCWAIYFYPDGRNPEDNSSNVSVFVALAREGTDVRVLFELTFVDSWVKGSIWLISILIALSGVVLILFSIRLACGRV